MDVIRGTSRADALAQRLSRDEHVSTIPARKEKRLDLSAESILTHLHGIPGLTKAQAGHAESKACSNETSLFRNTVNKNVEKA